MNSSNQPDKAPAEAFLHRKMGLLNATSIYMSNMIGIGPFITVPPILITEP
jgi:hypothetical protein